MKTPGINADEFLKSMAAEAVKQREQIRTAIRDLTLEALQIRELSLKQINNVVRNISTGVNLGVGDAKVDTGKALSDALAGMGYTLLKVVEANKIALHKLTDGGASFEDSSLKKGLKELESFEEKFLDSVKQASAKATEKCSRTMESNSRQNPPWWNRNRCRGNRRVEDAGSRRAGPPRVLTRPKQEDAL